MYSTAVSFKLCGLYCNDASLDLKSDLGNFIFEDKKLSNFNCSTVGI